MLRLFIFQIYNNYVISFYSVLQLIYSFSIIIYLFLIFFYFTLIACKRYQFLNVDVDVVDAK